jgi:hypothetical protein
MIYAKLLRRQPHVPYLPTYLSPSTLDDSNIKSLVIFFSVLDSIRAFLWVFSKFFSLFSFSTLPFHTQGISHSDIDYATRYLFSNANGYQGPYLSMFLLATQAGSNHGRSYCASFRSSRALRPANVYASTAPPIYRSPLCFGKIPVLGTS